MCNVSFIERLDPITLKVGTLAPADTPWIKILYDRIVYETSAGINGFLKIQVYGGGVMGDDEIVGTSFPRVFYDKILNELESYRKK
ncbi:MAG TPA: hypothetical protein VII00_05990 [bacterium]